MSIKRMQPDRSTRYACFFSLTDTRKSLVGGNLRPRLCKNYLLKLIVENTVLF